MKISLFEEGCIKFDNGNYIEDFHYQDCCEQVYADFNYIKNYNIIDGSKTVFDLEFEENILDYIEKVEDMGFNFLDKSGNKVFVPCYNIQDGYYSSNLSLKYYDCEGNLIKELDITNCTK